MQQEAACVWPRVHLGSHWGAYADEDVAHDLFDALMQTVTLRVAPQKASTGWDWRGRTSACGVHTADQEL